mgnify:CR=1 FL=1
MEKEFLAGIWFTLTLLFALNAKHLVIDFFVQNRFPYMWQNKHLLFHPGGWLHAGSHAIGTIVTLGLLSGFVPNSVLPILYVSLYEMVVHFFIDYFKMNLGKHFGWKPHTSPYFWDLLGIDQFLHQVTYLVMLEMLVLLLM